MPKLIDILRDTAPYISGALSLGGPAGIAAGAVLSSVLGVKKDASEAELQKALATASPETLLALRQADNDYKIAMRQADVQETGLYLADVANARQRQIAMNDQIPLYLACAIVGGYLFIIIFILMNGIPIEGRDAIVVIVGVLGAAVGSVVNYYFGSSRGSEQKTAMMKQMWDDTPSAADAVKKPLTTK